MSDAIEDDLPSAQAQLSAARFQAAVAAVGVMWTNDASGRMKGVQPGWADLTGQSEDAYQDYGWAAAVHPDDAQPSIDAWHDAVAAKRMFEMEHRVRRHDGEWRHFSIRAVPVMRDGEIVEWVGVHIDITDRFQAQERLRVSERRSQTILESIADGFYALDHDWRFVYVNPEAERILDCKPGALLGRVLWEAYPGIPGSVFDQAFRRVAASKQAESVQAFYPDHGRWYDVRAFPLANGLSVYFRDVTDAKEKEAALRASEERRRLALEAAELGAWNFDPRASTLTADERFYVIFTGSPGAVDYAGAVALIHPDDRARVMEAMAAAVRVDDPAPYAIEYRVVRPDGAVHWVFAKGRASVESVDGVPRVTSLDGTVADITTRRQADEDLRRFAAELSEADRRKDEFLATLAHELRNPLAPIRNGLQLMQRASYAPQLVEKTATVMDQQVRQMNRLVDDLLDVSRVSRNQLQLRKQPVTLASVLEQALETTRPLMASGGHDVVVHLPPQPVVLDGDVTRLVQVFSNLLNNAAKFSPPDSKIWLTAEAFDAEFIVTVRDEGIGIPVGMTTRIFDMFTRVDQSLERSQDGLGIGLTLVKRLVELHGGTVEARSAGEGTGSEFTVRLPRLRVFGGGEAAPEAVVEPLSSELKILVADDNQAIAEILVEFLEMMGNTVQHAHDGQEAVALAATFRPDVIVMDIGMPNLNGYEACRRIRQEAWGKSVVMIATTGWGQEEDKRRSKEAEFDHHFVKPVDFNALERLLANLR